MLLIVEEQHNSCGRWALWSGEWTWRQQFFRMHGECNRWWVRTTIPPRPAVSTFWENSGRRVGRGQSAENISSGRRGCRPVFRSALKYLQPPRAIGVFFTKATLKTFVFSVNFFFLRVPVVYYFIVQTLNRLSSRLGLPIPPTKQTRDTNHNTNCPVRWFWMIPKKIKLCSIHP